MNKAKTTKIRHRYNLGTIQILIDGKRRGQSTDPRWRKAIKCYTAAYQGEMQHATGAKGTPEHVRKKYSQLMRTIDNLKPNSSEADWCLQEAKVVVAANHHLDSLVKWAKDENVPETDVPNLVNDIMAVQRMVVAWPYLSTQCDDVSVGWLTNKWTGRDSLLPINRKKDPNASARYESYMTDHTISTAFHGWAR